MADFSTTYQVVISFITQAVVYGFSMGVFIGLISVPFSFLFKK